MAAGRDDRVCYSCVVELRRELRSDPRPTRGLRAVGIATATISLVVVLMTALSNLPQTYTPLWWVFFCFDLGHENTFASWWCGSWLLVAALGAMDGAACDRRAGRHWSSGWTSFALALALLSLDELGSIHARLASAWWVLGPLAALLGHALACFWWSPQRRRVVAGVLCGVAALAASAALDLAQDRGLRSPTVFNWPVAAEEGCELAAALVFANTAWRHGAWASSQAERLVTVGRGAAWLVTASCIVLYPLAWWTGTRWDQFRGHPADWMATLVSIAAAAAALRPFLCAGARVPRRALYQATIATLIGLASVLPLHFPAMLDANPPLNPRPYLLSSLLLALALGLWGGRVRLMIAGAGVLAAVVWPVRADWVQVYCMGQTAALVAFLGTRWGNRTPVGPPAVADR